MLFAAKAVVVPCAPAILVTKAMVTVVQVGASGVGTNCLLFLLLLLSVNIPLLQHLSQFTDIESHKEGSKFCLVGKATAVITLSEKYP